MAQGHRAGEAHPKQACTTSSSRDSVATAWHGTGHPPGRRGETAAITLFWAFSEARDS